MYLDFGTDELERGGPSEVLVLIVGIAFAFAIIYLLAQFAEETIKGGTWGYAKAVLELSFFPAVYFAVLHGGAWAVLVPLVWWFPHLYAEGKAQRAKEAIRDR